MKSYRKRDGWMANTKKSPWIFYNFCVKLLTKWFTSAILDESDGRGDHSL